MCLLLYLNAFHFYVAELEQTHSRVRKASQVKRESSGSLELHREITLTMSSALEVPYLASPLYCTPASPLLLPSAPSLHVGSLKGFLGPQLRCLPLLLLLVVFLSLKINLSWHLHEALRELRGKVHKEGKRRQSSACSSRNANEEEEVEEEGAAL